MFSAFTDIAVYRVYNRTNLIAQASQRVGRPRPLAHSPTYPLTLLTTRSPGSKEVVPGSPNQLSYLGAVVTLGGYDGARPREAGSGDLPVEVTRNRRALALVLPIIRPCPSTPFSFLTPAWGELSICILLGTWIV